MYESDHVIAKIEVEIQEELKEEDPNIFQKKSVSQRINMLIFVQYLSREEVRNGKSLKQQLKVGFKVT